MKTAQMADNENRIRLVLLGGAGVGKSSIIQRFLHNQFSEKYKSTVEDLYNRDYEVGHVTLKVDILDTAGEYQFPAMRRLSIANAHAFLLVYSIEQTQSFATVRQCVEEIREQRSDYEEIPIVIAGNKTDLVAERLVQKEDVSDYIYRNLSNYRCRIIECSAKENLQIKEIFRAFLHIGRLPLKDEVFNFKRQASAYSKNRSFRKGGPSSSVKESANEASSCIPSAPSSPSVFSRNKTRSRSLIRRSSRKTKQKVQETPADECYIS